MIDLVERLRELGAPDKLVQWIERGDRDLETAWEECKRGDHRVWLAAIAGAPVVRIVEAAAAAVLLVAADHEGAQPVTEAIERALAAQDGARCLELGDRCEALAQRGPGGYRGHRSRAYAALATAAAHVCRAREAVLAAELALEASRLDRARAASALIGGGLHAFLPADPGAASLLAVPPAHAARNLLSFATAASAHAVTEIARSRVPADAPRTVLAAAHRSLDSVVWESLAAE